MLNCEKCGEPAQRIRANGNDDELKCDRCYNVGIVDNPNCTDDKFKDMLGAHLNPRSVGIVDSPKIDVNWSDDKGVKYSNVYAREVWNEAIEAAANELHDNVYHEAQDTDWDLGYNEAKRMCIEAIRKLKK